LEVKSSLATVKALEKRGFIVHVKGEDMMDMHEYGLTEKGKSIYICIEKR
jgi:DNA-binding HxlR family transcriptional regulator